MKQYALLIISENIDGFQGKKSTEVNFEEFNHEPHEPARTINLLFFCHPQLDSCSLR
jgi:hypothetical protein